MSGLLSRGWHWRPRGLGRLARATFYLLALAALAQLVLSFREDLLRAGYGLDPQTYLAANALSGSLIGAAALSLAAAPQALAALSAAYILLEMTLLPSFTPSRMIAFAVIAFAAARVREGVAWPGIPQALLAAALYSFLAAAIAAAGYAAITWIAAPLSVLKGDAASFYTFLSSTRAWSYIAFLASIAVAGRLVLAAVNTASLAAAPAWLLRVESAREAEAELRELSSPISRFESLSAWVAASGLSLMLALTISEAQAGGRLAAALTIAASTIIIRIAILGVLSGRLRAVIAASAAAGIVITAALGPEVVMEAAGLGANLYYDPLTPLAEPEVGLLVESRLRQLDSLSLLLVRLLWGG